jgi:hypothetical protein
MKKILALVLGAVCAWFFAQAGVGAPTKKRATQSDDFMREKSFHCQSVLDALMKEQFDTIVLSGEAMKKMTKDPRWSRYGTDDYFRFSEQFQVNAEAMVDAARAKNLDRSMEAYIKSVQTCYNCHRYVRTLKNLNPVGAKNGDEKTLR